MSNSTINKRKNAPFSVISLNDRQPYSRTSSARIVVHHYIKQNFGVSSNIRGALPSIFETEEIVIEEQIASVSISKSIESPTGSFDVTLFPTQNWKQKISPGDWIEIYLFGSASSNKKFNNSLKNMVLLCNADRVSRRIEKNEDDDKTELRYVVSGRNFGKVFEETDIYFDPYANQQTIADVALQSAGVELVGNPSSMVNDILKVFLGPGTNIRTTGKTKPLKQWRIPIALAKKFGATTFANGADFPVFYDILGNQVDDGLPGYKTRNMISLGSSGSVWDYMSKSSNDMINEMFLELIRDNNGDVKPTIILRPRPYNTPFLDSQFGKELGTLKSFLKGKHIDLQQLAETSVLELSPKEIIFEDVGKDEHSRFNMFYLTSDRKTEVSRSIHANLNQNGKVGNPFITRESVQRHGLKRFEQAQEFDQPTGKTKAANELLLFKAFMAQTYDMHYANHLYENGTIETSGVLEAELGKVLKILPEGDKGLPRLFYIEGYEHEWSFPNTWRTTFTVTRGQWQARDGNIFIDIDFQEGRNTDFGQNDSQLDSTYVAKTIVTNKDSS